MKIQTCMSILILCLFSVCVTASIFKTQKGEILIDSLNAAAISLMSNPDEMLKVSKKAYENAKKISYKKGEAQALKSQGIAFYFLGNMEDALQMQFQSLDLQEELGDSLEIAKALYNIATVYNAQSQYERTTEYGLKAIKIFESIENFNGEGRVYNLLGIAAHRQGDLSKALEYLKLYKDKVTLADDSTEIANSLSNIGATYSEMKDYKSASEYLTKAMILYEKIGENRNIASVYENLGHIERKNKNLLKAKSLYEKGLKISNENQNLQRIASLNYHLGWIEFEHNQSKKALEHLNRGNEAGKSIGDKYIQSQILEKIAEIQHHNGNSSEAYNLLLEAQVLNDSIFQIEKMKISEELKTQYETEKKEKEIAYLNQEYEIQNLHLKQKNSYILLISAVLIGSVLVFFLLLKQRRLKAETRLQKALKVKQEEATLGILQAEERERGRIAAELHDGVGQMINAALFNLNQLQADIEKGNSPATHNLENALDLLENTYDEMRNISHQMMPNGLLKAGLAYSIRDFLDKMDKSYLKISLNVVGIQDRLDPQTEISLFRCVQESVNNVIKHAKADRLSIQIVKDDEGISISIEDNGKGFDKTKIKEKEGIGFQNIQARVNLLKGSFEVDSIPDKGTLLLIYIPSVKN